MDLSEQIVAPVGRLEVVPVVVEFVVVGPRMAVHGQSSESRDPAAMDTCLAGLASTQCPQPSRNVGVQILNTAVWGLEGVREQMGAVERRLHGARLYQWLQREQKGSKWLVYG
jgi:hypothetical protein